MSSITEYSKINEITGVLEYRGWRAQVQHPDRIPGEQKKLQKKFREDNFGSMDSAFEAASVWAREVTRIGSLNEVHRLTEQYVETLKKSGDYYRFRIGELSWEAVPESEEGSNTREIHKELKSWYDEARLPYAWDYFLTLRYTAKKWPKEKRCSEAPWSVHKYLNANPDRFSVIKPNMTVAEALAIMKYKDEGRSIRERVIVRAFPGVIQSGVIALQALKTFNRRCSEHEFDETQAEEIRHFKEDKLVKELSRNELFILPLSERVT